MTAIYTDAKQSLSPKKYADNHSMIIYAPPTPNHITVSRLYFLLHPRTLAQNKYVDNHILTISHLSQHPLWPSIVLPPPSPILDNHPLPLPLHSPRRHPRVRLISNTPTPPHPLLLNIPVARPGRAPSTLHISISRRHLHTPPRFRARINPFPHPFPLNIHFLPASTPVSALLRIRITNTHARPARARTAPPLLLLHLHQFNPRHRRRGRNSHDLRRGPDTDNRR